jgi:hypothetical protein
MLWDPKPAPTRRTRRAATGTKLLRRNPSTSRINRLDFANPTHQYAERQRSAAGSRGLDVMTRRTVFAWPVCCSNWFDPHLLLASLRPDRLLSTETTTAAQLGQASARLTQRFAASHDRTPRAAGRRLPPLGRGAFRQARSGKAPAARRHHKRKPPHVRHQRY